MDFRLIKTFDLVASFMSFNRAAKVLHCTQSTVSAQIKSLEEDLGTVLFERLGRRVALTAAGEALQHHARRLLSYEHDIRAAVSEVGATVGLISLRVPQSVADLHLPTILQRFCAKYPHVGFDISDCGYFHLPEELRTGEIEAGFLLDMPLEFNDLSNTEVLVEPMAFVASPQLRLAKGSNLTLHDLAGNTLLLPKHDCAYRMKLQQDLMEAHVQPAAVIELNSVTSVLRCLGAGLGVALLPERTVKQEVALRRLTKLRWHEPLQASLYFIRHRDKPLVGAYGAFVGEVEQYFAEIRAPATNTARTAANRSGHTRPRSRT